MKLLRLLQEKVWLFEKIEKLILNSKWVERMVKRLFECKIGMLYGKGQFLKIWNKNELIRFRVRPFASLRMKSQDTSTLFRPTLSHYLLEDGYFWKG